ncbi:MAG: hypothetical protein M3Z83_10780 [Actinomycetota bacterium]|nr:hypothetical protein [Actinomycetota bacterium]
MSDRPAEERHLTERERADLDAGRVRHPVGDETVVDPVGRRPVPVVATGVRPRIGVNWGAAFFGWVAAMGLAVILTALAAAIGAAIGVTTGSSVAQTADQISQNTKTVGIASGIVLGVIVFLAYYCGGYVASRMSRFEGVRQGFGVWVWAVVIAVLVAIAAAVAGAKYDVLSSINSFPRIPVRQGDLTTGGIIALAVLLVVSLLGALVGGRAGMHYHRKLEAEVVGRDVVGRDVVD